MRKLAALLPMSAALLSCLSLVACPDRESSNLTAACGNGVADLGEVCDGADLGGATCTDLGFANPDGLACVSCQIDSAGCSATCGNGVSELSTGTR